MPDKDDSDEVLRAYMEHLRAQQYALRDVSDQTQASPPPPQSERLRQMAMSARGLRTADRESTNVIDARNYPPPLSRFTIPLGIDIYPGSPGKTYPPSPMLPSPQETFIPKNRF